MRANPLPMFLRQTLALTWAQMRAWCATPHHALLSITLAVSYLVIINQSFVVQLTKRVVMGVYTKDIDVGQRLRDELTGKGMAVVAYATWPRVGTRSATACWRRSSRSTRPMQNARSSPLAGAIR